MPPLSSDLSKHAATEAYTQTVGHTKSKFQAFALSTSSAVALCQLRQDPTTPPSAMSGAASNRSC